MKSKRLKGNKQPNLANCFSVVERSISCGTFRPSKILWHMPDTYIWVHFTKEMAIFALHLISITLRVSLYGVLRERLWTFTSGFYRNRSLFTLKIVLTENSLKIPYNSLICLLQASPAALHVNLVAGSFTGLCMDKGDYIQSSYCVGVLQNTITY